MGLLTYWMKDKRTSVFKDYMTGSVLDAGCGYADIYEKFKDKIDEYYGIESNDERVSLLKKRFPKARFYKRDLDNDVLKFNKRFDRIVSIAVIEHLFNQKHSFGELVKNLKPGGKILITTPTPFGNDIVHRVGSRVGLFSQNAHDDHIIIYNKQRFEILAKEFGLQIEKYKKFQFGCNQLVVMKK